MLKITHVNLFKSIPIGVYKQLDMELSAIRNLNIDWNVLVFSNDSLRKDWHRRVYMNGFYGYFYGRFCFFKEVLSELRRNRKVLLRYSISDPVQALFSFWFKDVVTIHHTFEIEESFLVGGLKGRVKGVVEKIVGYLVLQKVVGVIGVTEEIAKYEVTRSGRNIPFYVAPNGVDLTEIKLPNDQRDSQISLLFVASTFSPWHGLDLLLDSIEKSSRDFRLFVAGEVPSSLLARIQLDSRITYLGTINKDEINRLSAQCDLGISSLALCRKGMQEACTLKVREYLATGLPCYADHIDSGLPVDFPYFRRGCANIEDICNFAQEMKSISKSTVRQAAAQYIDKKAIVEQTYQWLKYLYNE